VRAVNVAAAPIARQAELAELVASGRLRPPATRTFPLEHAADALAELAGSHVRGKLVITPN
jgi:NADPH:quinone reductase-like Zn-dependent oxidoreductase